METRNFNFKAAPFLPRSKSLQLEEEKMKNIIKLLPSDTPQDIIEQIEKAKPEMREMIVENYISQLYGNVFDSDDSSGSWETDTNFWEEEGLPSVEDLIQYGNYVKEEKLKEELNNICEYIDNTPPDEKGQALSLKTAKEYTERYNNDPSVNTGYKVNHCQLMTVSQMTKNQTYDEIKMTLARYHTFFNGNFA
ncbi:hypothetical protein EIN_052800 [Entamoeba invadens IP1]|uniref:hypothetical protein n=1 Tax=Entamoeba invadens IP1 TaxID=370355 RepID=UPI0002C3F9AA|nr:hypothetical protein EIN_052800 [Entamoeba invadens IP1]ELP93065.1 hypothetical protein EIN_052800 [Entamoeba invadens IP1]|eukprot:XP_004259836.1 hypothetical protein EIN_052800 [Entamoeba invadens IP1]